MLNVVWNLPASGPSAVGTMNGRVVKERPPARKAEYVMPSIVAADGVWNVENENDPSRLPGRPASHPIVPPPVPSPRTRKLGPDSDTPVGPPSQERKAEPAV